MIISKTPLRASLFGGGTDFAEYFHNSKYGYGMVISAALDMHVYITVNKRFDDKIRIVYSGNELVDSVEGVRHNIIREALSITGIEKGIEVVYMADLPMTNQGIGLASSSALAVGVLNALHAYKGEYVTPKELAREAVQIEIDRLGQQIGIQDQYAVSYGGLNQYIFNFDDTVSVTPIRISADEKKTLLDRLMLFYTGQTRDSRSIFDEQKQTIKSNKDIYDALIEITLQALDCIRKGNFDVLGELLKSSWEIKKQFASGISNRLVDDMYQKALQSGALGGKILGAGGGGFLLLYVPLAKQTSVREVLHEFREIPFEIDMQGSRIVFSD